MTLQVCNFADVAHFATHPARGKAGLHTFKSPTVWIAKAVDGTPVGCCSLMRLSPTKLRLGNLFVLPQHRGCGYGLDLCRFSLALARAQGFAQVDSRTWVIGLFQSAGFRIVKEYRGGGHACIIDL